MTSEPAGVDGLVRLGNLDAVPSIHGDLVFAETVYRSVLSGAYDVIALELPCDVSVGDLAAAVDRMWPAPGVALIKGPPLGARRFPVDDQERQVADAEALIPLVGCDSLIAAIRAFSRLQKRSPERLPILEFCDLPVRSEPGRRRARLSLPDSWFVVRSGLGSYLENNRATIEAGRFPGDDARELAMAAALRRHLSAGKRVLFVCGMAHWERILELLDAIGRVDAGPPEMPRVECRKIETFALIAAEAWWLGLMGIPALVGSFVDHLETGPAESAFDLPGAVSRLIQGALVQARDVEEQTVSVRSCLAFNRYLESKLALRQRWCPELDSDLTSAAEACVDAEFANTLKQTALAYPFDPPDRMPVARAVRLEDRAYLLADRQAYLLGMNDDFDGEGESRTLPLQEPVPLGPDEITKFRKLPCRRFPSSEDELQRICIEFAWSIGERRSRLNRSPEVDLRTARFQGDLGRGIHWRKTVAAWLEGAPQDSFFVKIPTRRRDPSTEPEDRAGEEMKPCPVAWMFTPRAAVQDKVSGVFAPRVYSSFYWLASSNGVASGCIVRERVAFCVNILRGQVTWEPYLVRSFLKKLPSKFQPAIAPWLDPELVEFKGADLAVAAGIKYAAARVIVVADGALLLGRKLLDYAKSRDPAVEIIRLNWSIFPWEARQRLALQHTLPSPEFGEQDPRLLAQIPAVPAFPGHWTRRSKP